jgi:hypothetical protein
VTITFTRIDLPVSDIDIDRLPPAKWAQIMHGPFNGPISLRAEVTEWLNGHNIQYRLGTKAIGFINGDPADVVYDAILSFEKLEDGALFRMNWLWKD